MHMLLSRILCEPEQVDATALVMPSIMYGLGLRPDGIEGPFDKDLASKYTHLPYLSYLLALRKILL